MNLKFLFCFVSLSISMFAYGQDARAILDKASETYNKSGGITAQFTLDVRDVRNKTTYSYDGNIKMKGNSYRMEIPEGITWFDGETQWVYMSDSEEVTINTPDENELGGVSPAALFNVYKTGYDLKYKGMKIVANRSVLEVEMTPIKKSDFSKIIILLDKTTNLFSKITVVDKSGLENIISIRNMKTGVDLPDSVFSFPKDEYPEAEVIDLR